MRDDAGMAVTATIVILAPPASRREWVDALAAAPDLEVVGEVADAQDVDAVVAESVPDVALVDLATPFVEPADLCRRLSDVSPVTRILLVDDGAGAPVEAMAAGAAGATSRTDLAADVAGLVRRVARSEGVLTSAWAASLVARDDGPRFTATEREVLQRLAKGGTLESVASMHEVPSHVVGLHAGYALAKVHRAALDASSDGVE